jgi:hypothetical protein
LRLGIGVSELHPRRKSAPQKRWHRSRGLAGGAPVRPIEKRGKLQIGQREGDSVI